MMDLRLKNLARTKAYREAIAGVQEPATLMGSRKRVIIAPSMANAAERGGSVGDLQDVARRRASAKDKQTSECGGIIENADLKSYKAWVKERKQLRKDLNQCGMVSDWLQSKPSLTEIEQRVQKSHNAKSGDISMIGDIESRKKSDNGRFKYGQHDSKYPPAIDQPLPVALSIINEYLAKKKLRFFDLFVQADRDKDWKVTREEFKNIMIRAGIPLKDAEIDHFLEALDENNNHVLEYKELAHGRDLFILNERTKKHSEDAALQPSDSSGKLLDALGTGQYSSQSYLSLPGVSSSDHIFTARDQDNEKRLKRQKRREKHRQNLKSSDKVEREFSTMGGVTGMLVDTYQRQKESEYERILELCHLHGVPLSKNLLEKVLLHPEDEDAGTCISSLKPPSRYLLSDKEMYRGLAPSNVESARKRLPNSKRKISFYSYHVYPPAASVTPKSERMNLSSGPASISRKADCWMTYEEYCNLTRHLDSRFEKSWKPLEENPYWPSYVFDKVRLYLERPRTQVRSENSIFEIVHNRTIH